MLVETTRHNPDIKQCVAIFFNNETISVPLLSSFDEVLLLFQIGILL